MSANPSKTLLIALIERGGAILMRKKPAGSPPYSETWYLFGCEQNPAGDDPDVLGTYLKETLRITATVDKLIDIDTETKADADGMVKDFTYITFHCTHRSGHPAATAGVELIEWVPRDKLADYDLVPPSEKLFKKIGYLK